MSTVSKREEFLFIYDVTMANPNGDPVEENKPRIDEETNHNLVTDVRLKRTIRDYLYDYKGHDGTNGKDIFVRQTEMEKGGLKDGKSRVADFHNSSEEILQGCIDIRLFGGVLPMDKSSFTYTGPVQIKMGRSLHKVAPKYIRGTGAFASTAGKKQNTFRDEYILPYSLIGFYGVINENAAKHTGLTEADVTEFYDAMWVGTQNLLSRSKMGHMPRLLIRIRHKEANFFFGDLDRKVKAEFGGAPEALRGPDEITVNLDALAKVLDERKDKVSAFLRWDESLSLSNRGDVLGAAAWNP